MKILLLLALYFNVLQAQLKYVTIGTQVWMTNNLNVATFRNGDAIPEAKTDEEWRNAGENQQPAWCYYKNDPVNGAKYGKLYNWYAVNDNRGIAPQGWHVSSYEEWSVLENYLGGKGHGSVAHTKMKSKSGWKSYMSDGKKYCQNCLNWSDEYKSKVPCHTCKDKRFFDAPIVTISGNGTNTSGFTAVPGGTRNVDGKFSSVGEIGEWWTTTVHDPNPEPFGPTSALSCYIGYNATSEVLESLSIGDNRAKGYSIRCLRD